MTEATAEAAQDIQPTKRRRFLAVTMQEALWVRVKQEAAEADVPITAWVRGCVNKELERLDASR